MHSFKVRKKMHAPENCSTSSPLKKIMVRHLRALGEGNAWQWLKCHENVMTNVTQYRDHCFCSVGVAT